MEEKKIREKVAILLIAAILIANLIGQFSNRRQEGENEPNQTQPSSNQVTSQGDNDETQELENDNKTQINIASLKGPTSMGLVKIMEDNENNKTSSDYNFTIVGTADEISPGIINGDFQIAAVPANLASVLYNKSDGKLAVAGINTLGVLYIVETGEQINSIEDLRGKTIYSTGKGTTPEYTLNYLLESNGIDPVQDVNVEYKSEATEVAVLLSEAEDAVAMLPEPYVTTVMMNNDKVRKALDVAEEWEKADKSGSAVTTGVVVVNKEFLENHPEEVNNFLDEYSLSVEYVNNNVKEAAELIEKFDIFKAVVAEKAIPESNIVLITGDQMKTKLEGYLNVLYEQNPNSVGGRLPKDDFYYRK